jgi:hypothetical protein
MLRKTTPTKTKYKDLFPSNSRRSSWTTRWPRDRPLHSTPRPQEGVARYHRNRHVLRRPLPLVPPTLTTVAKARVMARGREKTRMAPTTTAGAPLHGPPTIPGPTPSRCGQGCVHRSAPCLRHRRTMGHLTAPPSRTCRRLHRTNSRPWPLPGRPGWARRINNH